ncbi:Pyruvate:ferredoxin oxidoreductase and related 2-oxoacid:ferredoxin oxidoreductases, beta subunit [Nostoc flagelliforme CCNUN1]|uniref:Pyruvate:ferredoxin oxidoreductase and related 2-oxoacid:ferredoxin oxidoreductases, beta subunit n=1 Tax=Nostoc flagelliforme CCNUN1 TaxID=2038116 RepID=A0A2K8SJB2_9NOSO|nr:Pyruvate:ferredoxin oxidoreductase and related 2-oxoacid:ferredoxin oxidoreductases, beta subunit [Nostoc flagelliforme CCNUN1]
MDEFLTVAKILKAATEQPPTEDELLDKEFDALTSDEWERLKRYVPQAKDLVAA